MSNNKIALVTGGSRGLGKDMALSLAKKGINVVLTYNSKKDEAEAVVAEIESIGQKAATLQLDAGDVKSFDNFFAQLKTTLKDTFGTEHFDFLINNAGVGYHASIADTTEEKFDMLVNLHFKGVYFLTQKALPVINDGGRIINISSGLARFSMPGASAYAAMKGAVETVAQAFAGLPARRPPRPGRHRHPHGAPRAAPRPRHPPPRGRCAGRVWPRRTPAR